MESAIQTNGENKMNTTLAYCEEKIEGALNQKLFALCTSGLLGLFSRKSFRNDKELCLKTSNLVNAIECLNLQRLQFNRGWDGVSSASIAVAVKECMGATLELGSLLGDSYPHEYARVEIEGADYVKNCWALAAELAA